MLSGSSPSSCSSSAAGISLQHSTFTESASTHGLFEDSLPVQRSSGPSLAAGLMVAIPSKSRSLEAQARLQQLLVVYVRLLGIVLIRDAGGRRDCHTCPRILYGLFPFSL